MPLPFLDTSALVKLYFEEAGSRALQLLATRTEPLAICSMGVIEFRAVVRAKERGRALAVSASGAMLDHFECVRQAWTYQPVNEAVFALGGVLLDRYPLRAPDALQLAAAMALNQIQAVEFICSDQRLLAAARSEGLACWDPAGGVE